MIVGRSTWAHALAILAACAALSGAAGAANLIVNGTFESNGGVDTAVFTGWTEVDQAGSAGSFFVQTGTAPPLSGSPPVVPAPPQGSFAAMSNQGEVTASFLYQDVAIPASGPATFQARIYINNFAPFFVTPNSLDYNNAPNQQARIDIVNPAAPINDTGAGVLLPIYRTNVGDPLVSGYTQVSANLSQFAGQTVRLRFAVVVTDAPLLFGIDDVAINTGAQAVPALPPWGTALLVIAIAMMGFWLLRRARR
jgi:hypothetical protein